MDLTPDQLGLGLIWFAAFLFSITLHEAAHALAAWRLGDRTAYEAGQVSLNPLPHIRREPFGMIVVPLLSFALSGWMIGWASAPYDRSWAERYPRRAAWMALAGPCANLLLVLLCGAAIRLGLATGALAVPETFGFAQIVGAGSEGLAGVAAFLSILFTLNLLLLTFNLLPLPPLDGSAVLPLLLPERAARGYRALLAQPMLAIVGILVAWRVFGELFSPVLILALRLLYP